MEEWKDINGYEGKYKISSYGRVWSAWKSKYKDSPYLSPYLEGNGYLQVELGSKALLVHRLVAEHFLDKPSSELIESANNTKNKKVLVNHKDGIKTNNNVDNLEWTDYSGNSLHSFKIGTQTARRGEDNNKSKLTETQVIEILHKYENSKRELIESLSTEYNISKDAIVDILTHKTWRHIRI